MALEWVGGSPAWELLAAAVALLALLRVMWSSPRDSRVSWGHLVALVPCVCFGVMLGTACLHLEFGTPITDCSGELDRVEACQGRDWSAGQGRLSVRRATGTLQREACTAFADDVAPTLAQRTNDQTSGPGRRCTLAAPHEWAEVSCADVGLSAFARCFECAGWSEAADVYVSVLATDARCEHVTLTRTVNMPSLTAAQCLMDTTRTDVCHGASVQRRNHALD